MGGPVALQFELLVSILAAGPASPQYQFSETQMALIIRGATLVKPDTVKPPTKRQRGHTRPSSVELLDLSKPGRVRVGHMLTLFGVSHSTFYKRMNDGLCPKADGRDGSRPYWRTETVRQALMS